MLESVTIANVEKNTPDASVHGDSKTHLFVQAQDDYETAAAECEQHNSNEVDSSDGSGYDTNLEDEDKPLKNPCETSTSFKVYLKACQKFGMVSSSYFIDHLDEEILCMRYHGLGPSGAKAVALALTVNNAVLRLDLEDNGITADGMHHLAEMLIRNCYITNLNVSQNKLSGMGASHICRMLLENTTLCCLTAARNEFKDKHAKYFADSLGLNYTLKELDLSGNEFCEVGGEFMAKAITANDSIEYLNLSWNHLRRKGAIAIAAGMKTNTSIETLDLSWNGFADDGAMAMGVALKFNTTLTSLDLSNNRISDRGAAAFAKGLGVNHTLRTLRIGSNPFRSDGAMHLLKAIYNNNKSAIEELDLKGIPVNNDFLRLAEELRGRRSGDGRNLFSFFVHEVDDPLKVKQEEAGDPMLALQKFLETKRLRAIDLFRSFDKDLSWKISPAEFRKGIAQAGIPLSKYQQKILLRQLDVDIDGQINYRELVSGQKDAVRRRREEKKKEERESERRKEKKERFHQVWLGAVEAVTPDASPTSSTARMDDVTQTVTSQSRVKLSPESPRRLSGGRMTRSFVISEKNFDANLHPNWVVASPPQAS